MTTLIPADPRWEQLDELQAALDAQTVIGPSERQLVDTSTWGPKSPTWVYGVAGPEIASPGPINNTSTTPSKQQLTLAAENAPIRFGYGRDRIGADVLNVVLYAGYVYVQCLWGRACKEIESVTFNDEPLDAAIEVRHYTGSQSTVDSWMQTAFSNQSPTVAYADTLAGYSYSVFKVPADKFNGGFNFAAIIKWANVYDPRKNSLTEAGHNGYVTPMSTSGTAAGITMSVVGSGVEAGIPYIDVQVSGTATGTAYPAFYFNGASPLRSAQTVSGNTWHGKVFAKIISGSLGTDGYAFVSHWGFTYPGGVYTEGVWLDFIVSSTNPLNACERGGSGALSNASTGQMVSGAAAYVKAGETANAVIRVGLPRVWHSSGSDPYAYSDNPSLCLADFLSNPEYGAGGYVDWSTVSTCANWNDTPIGGNRSRILNGFTLTSVVEIDSAIETLRTYASVFLVDRGRSILLVPDRATDSCATYSHVDGTIRSYGPVDKRDVTNLPTMVEVKYTNTDAIPWVERSAFSPSTPGEVVRRLSTIRLNGIQRHEQAYREAVERLNKLVLNDLSFKITIFDTGIKHEIGDVITVTLPFGGITGKPMRVVACEAAGHGLWELSLNEYDQSVYSSDVVTAPTNPDTSLPSPLYPPPPSLISTTEEMFQQADGSWNSRLRITITPPALFNWVAAYRVEIYDNTLALVDTATVIQPYYATPPLKEGINYTIKVATLSTVSAISTWAQTSRMFTGKLAPPADVTSITGFEIAGSVFLSWTASNDLDLRDYEIRYAATDVGWSGATMIDRVNALRTEIKGMLPAGTWWFYVKARDTINNYSATAAKCSLTVTLDPNALQTEAYDTTPTTSGMVSYVENGVTYDQTLVGATTFGAQFTNNLGTYTAKPVGAYWGGSFTWEAPIGNDPWGVLLSGDWNVDWVHSNLDGTATKTLRLSEDNSNWTDYTALPAKDTARYAKVKLSGTGAIKVRRGGTRAYVNATTREEVGNSTSVAGAKTITMTGNYYTWRDFSVQVYDTGTGNDDRYFTFVDNIVLHPTNDNTFDVHILDAAGNHASGIAFNWKFKGI